MSNANGRAVVMELGNNCQEVANFLLKLSRSLGLHLHRHSRYELIPIQFVGDSLLQSMSDVDSSLNASLHLVKSVNGQASSLAIPPPLSDVHPPASASVHPPLSDEHPPASAFVHPPLSDEHPPASASVHPPL